MPIDPNELHTLLVQVTDEDGKPLEGADLVVNVWNVDSRDLLVIIREYVTNSQGTATIQFPRRLTILQMWANKAGRVPRWVTLSNDPNDEKKRFPQKYGFQLEKGAQIGGTIVDEGGKPIAGVEVHVEVIIPTPDWEVNPQSVIFEYLTLEDYSSSPPVTDKQGRWKIDNAPPPKHPEDYEFQILFHHKDYASDVSWGDYQENQNITTKLLRSQTATLVMSEGIIVTGSVVDDEGIPVTKGLVIWSESPHNYPVLRGPD